MASLSDIAGFNRKSFVEKRNWSIRLEVMIHYEIIATFNDGGICEDYLANAYM